MIFVFFQSSSIHLTMKKTLLSIVLLLAIALTGQAQVERRPNPRHRHHPAPTRTIPHYHTRYIPDFSGDFRIHAIADVGLFDMEALIFHNYPSHFSLGAMAEYQIGRVVSLGLGAEFYSSRGVYNHTLHNNMDQLYLRSLPIYANLRLSVPGNGLRPFVEGRAGYAIPLGTVSVYNTGNAVVPTYEAGGLYTGVAAGLTYGGSNFSVGFTCTDLHNVTDGYNGRRSLLTDFYIRYSYAFRVN